jgi:hypothetical protein
LKPSAGDCTRVSHDNADPRACYRQWRDGLCGDGLLLVDFKLPQYWQQQAPALALTALYYQRGDSLRVGVSNQLLELEGLPPAEQFAGLLRQHRLAVFDPRRPLQLVPEPIAKPWGREVWYSAVETRGVCQFEQQQARAPIPWVQAVMPDAAAGKPGQPLVLLKLLEPASEPELGDLYFELHEHKCEVYIVIDVDRRAWPDGIGRIRYGFDREQLERSRDEAGFRSAYLAAVQAYEATRRTLDCLPPGQQPDAGLLQRERVLREQMYSFTHLQPVRVGDVIVVPNRLPHSLQHGVRVIEFQTPVYERKILSFGQRVLTQEHWDTREAVALMCLQAPRVKPFPSLFESLGTKVSEVANVADFAVRRVAILPGDSWQLDGLPGYALVMVVSGVLRVGGDNYPPEQALLLPAAWGGELACGPGAEAVVLLVATAGP